MGDDDDDDEGDRERKAKEKVGRRKKRWLAYKGQDLFFISFEHSSGGVGICIRGKHICLDRQLDDGPAKIGTAIHSLACMDINTPEKSLVMTIMGM